MIRKPIYIDLDQTLVAPVFGGSSGKDLLGAEARPDAAWFLEAMARYGDLHLLSWATRGWIRKAFHVLEPSAKLFKGIFSREDLQVVAEQMDIVEKTAGLSDRERLELYRDVRPIAPPGVVFDDFPAGSWMHRVKSLATGTFLLGPHLWIQVKSYEAGGPDGGLREAYEEFQSRNNAWRGWPPKGSRLAAVRL